MQDAGRSSNNAQEELQKVDADFRMLGKPRGAADQIRYTTYLRLRASVSQKCDLFRGSWPCGTAAQVQELFDIKLDRSEFQKMWDR